MIITSIAEKVLNACHRLNAEAYEQQVINARKRLKNFLPCAKAEVLMSVIRTNEHFGTAHMRACLTVCSCHRTLTENQLMAYEYDPTYKEANYRGDLHQLYPLLYPRPNV